jgi:hypothetical protein
MLDKALVIAITIGAPLIWLWEKIKKFLIWVGLMDEEVIIETKPSPPPPDEV